MRVAVVGLGRVGLPVASYLSTLHDVAGFDTNVVLMQRLRSGENPLPFEPQINLKRIAFSPRLDHALSTAHMVYVMVPTPTKEGRISSEHVRQAIAEIRRNWRIPIIVGSTIEPSDASVVCSDISVGYSPPFIRLGHVVEDLRTAKVLLSGTLDYEMHMMIRALWQQNTLLGDPVTIATAKLAVNASLSLRVAWANEIAEVCRESGADPDLVLHIVQQDPRIGRGYMTAGWSPSGPCLPRDLESWAHTDKAPLARQVLANHAVTRATMIGDTVQKLRALEKWKVGVLGMTYNPGAFDTTDSLGFTLAQAIRAAGYAVRIYDPAQYYLGPLGLNEAISVDDLVSWADVVVIATAWPEFSELKTEKLVIDLRT